MTKEIALSLSSVKSVTMEQLQAAMKLIEDHQTELRNAFGTSGTGFEKVTFTNPPQSSVIQRLQTSVNINQQQAEIVYFLWPVYELGYRASNSSTSKS